MTKKRFLAVITAILVLSVSLLGISGPLSGSAATLVTLLYNFEDLTDETAQTLVSAAPEGAGAKTDAVITASVYTAEAGDSKLGAGTKALKVATDAAGSTSGFLLKLDGSKLAGSSALALHLAMDVHSQGMFFQLVMADGSRYTLTQGVNGVGDDWTNNMSKWALDDGGQNYIWKPFHCGKPEEFDHPCQWPDFESAWIKIPFIENKLVKVAGDAEAFRPEDVTGLLILGSSDCYGGADKAMYVDEVYAVNVDDNTPNFVYGEAPKAEQPAAMSFQGYTSTPIYDFENFTENDGAKIILKNVTGLTFDSPSDYTLTAELYTASGDGDTKVGAGSKALKISADTGCTWPPRTFTLALDGADLKDAEALTFHLAMDELGSDNAIVIQWVMKDGSVWNALPTQDDNGQIAGRESGSAKKLNPESGAFEGFVIINNAAYLSYPNVDASGAWFYMPLDAQQLEKMADTGTEDTFAVENIAGLRIGGQSFGGDNHMYLDEIYTAAPAPEEPDEPEEPEEPAQGTVPPARTPAATSFQGYTSTPIYDFEDFGADDWQKILSKNVTGLTFDNASDYALTAELYTKTGFGDTRIGAGSKALKISADTGCTWPPRTFTLALNGADLKGEEALTFHLAMDELGTDNGIVIQWVMKDGSIWNALPTQDDNGQIAGRDSGFVKKLNPLTGQFQGFVVTSTAAYLSYPSLDASGAWFYMPLDAKQLEKMAGTGTENTFAVENIVGLRIGGQSFGGDNHMYLDEVYSIHPGTAGSTTGGTTSGGTQASPSTGDADLAALGWVMAASGMICALAVIRKKRAAKAVR